MDENSARDESASVKSEESAHGSTNVTRNEFVDNGTDDRDSPLSRPDENEKSSEVKQAIPNDVAIRDTSEVDGKDERGQESPVCTPPQMTNPLDSLAALSNLPNG